MNERESSELDADSDFSEPEIETSTDSDKAETDRDKARADWLRLSLVVGIGPRNLRQLIDYFGSPGEVFGASRSNLQEVPGIGPKTSRAVADAREVIDVDAELALCRANNIEICTLADEDYPRMLREIPDAPPVLFMRGTVTSDDMLSVAVVGSRHATTYGRKQARRLAAGLARAGLTVISGLARGIDGEAHRGALEADGRTLAVLGGGLLALFPPEHKPLADEVAASGAVISDFPPLMEPQSGFFPQRNRVISGLSLARTPCPDSRRRATRAIDRRCTRGTRPAGRGRATRRRAVGSPPGRAATERHRAKGTCRDWRGANFDRRDRHGQRPTGATGAGHVERARIASPHSPGQRAAGGSGVT